MKDVVYSFIIPHKNTPELLCRCIDSIPIRDDIQIIVVDDNSDTDKTPNKLRDDVELTLLDASQSKGAGRARNIGMTKARGEWLLFADADDYYTEALMFLLDKYADDGTTELVFLNACIFDENNTIKPFLADKLISNYLLGKRNGEQDLRYGIWTPWSRMVKRSIVEENNIVFDELPACNDKMFGLLCSYYSTNISVEKETVYMYYRPSFGSQTDNNRNLTSLDGLLDVRRKTICLYKKVGYKPIPSYFSLLYKSQYTKGLTLKEIVAKYINCLHKSKVNILVDLWRYCQNKLNR